MKILRALLTLLCVICPVTGFADEDLKRVSYKKMIQLNSGNIDKITTGMTKDEVVQIMGNIQSTVRSGPINNPWKIDAHGEREVLHYITSGHPPFTPILANQATPIVLKDGRVIGIGRGALKQIGDSESPAPAKPTESTEKSIGERLETLKKLYDDGTIDKETYDTQRRRILESI